MSTWGAAAQPLLVRMPLQNPDDPTEELRFEPYIAYPQALDAAVNDLLEAVRDYSDSDRITAAAARVRALREGNGA